jgi:hypothetical protein
MARLARQLQITGVKLVAEIHRLRRRIALAVRGGKEGDREHRDGRGPPRHRLRWLI